jgi:hypothetical protein
VAEKGGIMTIAACTDEEFISLWNTHKSSSKVANALGIQERNVLRRRRNIEAKHGVQLSVRTDNPVVEKHSAKIHVPIENGVVVVFSDAHFWDNTPTTAYRALIKFLGEIKPRMVVCNGDAFDGASISRHGRIGFLENRPSVIKELHACQEMLTGISDAARGALLTWPLGNHDSRFETHIAAQAPQYEFVQGFHLKDHFPEWKPCWATWINQDTVIKHRWKGGIGATRANALNSGVSLITGHLHSLKVTPLTDYNGTRYGVDTGTLADVEGDQFVNYTEAGPLDWRSGFAVLTFWRGRLLPPELVEVIGEGLVSFRGKVYEV